MENDLGMSKRSRRRASFRAVAIGVGIVIGLGSCSGESVGHPDSYRFREKMRSEGPDGRVDTIIREGEYDGATQTTRLLHFYPEASEGQRRYQTTEVIQTRDAIYSRLSEDARERAPTGILWERIDLPPQFQQTFGGISPSDFTFKDLRRRAHSVKKLGNKQLRGTDTIRFRIVLGRNAFVNLVQDLVPALGSRASRLPKRFVLHIWVDDQDRPHRTRYTIGKDGTTVTATTDAFDFGAPVSIPLPDPGQVTDEPIRPGGP